MKHQSKDERTFEIIACELGITTAQAEKAYFTGMCKILHPRNKDKILKLLLAWKGDEQLARQTLVKGTWKTKNKESK